MHHTHKHIVETHKNVDILTSWAFAKTFSYLIPTNLSQYAPHTESAGGMMYATRVCHFFQEIYPLSANINSSPKTASERSHTADIKVLSFRMTILSSQESFCCHQSFGECVKFCECVWQIKYEDFIEMKFVFSWRDWRGFG